MRCCNDGDRPCPHLIHKRKPKCDKYKCGLTYCKKTTKFLGTIWTIYPTQKCVEESGNEDIKGESEEKA